MINQQKLSTSLTKQEKIIGLIAFFSILTIYALLHLRYYPYYVDDAWFVSRAYGFMETGRTEDFLFRFPTAPDRILLFEKTFYFFYGNVLELIGWTKSNAVLLSTFFIWMSGLVWHFILRALGFSAKTALVFGLGILIFPMFFSTANLVRPDAMAFFSASLTFLLFIKKRYFLAGAMMLFSAEVHLMGVTSFFYITAYFIYQRKEFLKDTKKLFINFLIFCAGALLGLLYYYQLHKADLSLELFTSILSIKKEMKGGLNNYILRYFAHYYWYRHIWEAVFLLTTTYLFIKNKLWKKNAFVPIFFLTMLLSTFITSRPNWHYMIYFFPSILLLFIFTFEELGKLKEFIITVSAILVIIYGAHFWVNKDWRFEKSIKETRSHLMEKDIPVIGMADNWFAVPERTFKFYPIYHSVFWIEESDLEEAYLIKNDYLGHHSRNYESLIEWLENNYRMTEVANFTVHGDKQVEILYCKKKE